jgi:hypothetical protein
MMHGDLVQDKPSFVIAHGQEVSEFDGLDARSVLATIQPRNGAIAATQCTSAQSGQSFLALALESGALEVWDLASYTRVDSIALSTRDRLSRGGGAKGPPVVLAGSTSLSAAVIFAATAGLSPPLVTAVRVHPSLGMVEQRMAGADESRKKTSVVGACVCMHFHGHVWDCFHNDRPERGSDHPCTTEPEGCCEMVP